MAIWKRPYGADAHDTRRAGDISEGKIKKGGAMGGQQKQKKKGCRAAGRGKDHRAYQARERHPDQVLRRIIRSSGFAEAKRYAEEHGLNRALEAIQKNQVQQPNPGFLPVPVRWIERKKMEAEKKAMAKSPALRFVADFAGQQ